MPSQEQLARQWAEEQMAIEWNEPERVRGKLRAAAEYILANLPEPTMADVEWDDEKHYLAGATALDGQLEVMMWLDDTERGHIITDQGAWRPEQLTPNGKQYELREVGTIQESRTVHPTTLTTVEDYAYAPKGTVVAGADPLEVYVSSGYAWLKAGDLEDCSVPSDWIGRTTRKVLRWGLGD